jgi:hypothetical protein
MFADFKNSSISLGKIMLDDRNPRIVSQKILRSQTEILKYFFEHEKLEAFIKKIANEGLNPGAELPYVIKNGINYKVIEGNTRIAAYKLLARLINPPKGYENTIPLISNELNADLQKVECIIAPSRDSLLPIMANAHFGLGDKSKWGYLGSRKAIYDELQNGKTVTQIAKAFSRTEGEINDLIIDYKLYQKALDYSWTSNERNKLLNPSVEFNPPVRFLQTSGHKQKIGISYDKANLKLNFDNKEAENKFRHLVLTLVVNPVSKLGATASYEEVFSNYKPLGASASTSGTPESGGTASDSTKDSAAKSRDQSPSDNGGERPKKGTYALFSYSNRINSGLLTQLMKEARGIHSKNFPAAATFLLRNILEAILKHIIDEQGGNPNGSLLDLERCINISLNNSITLSADDKRILGEFKKMHLGYLNLGAHGTTIPNFDRLMSARDCVDQFVKNNV